MSSEQFDYPRLRGPLPPGILDDTSSPSEALVSAAAQLLTGSNSWSQVWGALLTQSYSPASIDAAFTLLESHGLIESAGDGDRGEHASHAALLNRIAGFDGSAGIDLASQPSADHLARECTVAVVAASPTKQDRLREHFRGIGMGEMPDEWYVDLWEETTTFATSRLDAQVEALAHETSPLIVCAIDGNRDGFALAVNSAAIAFDVSAIFHRSFEMQASVGPLLIPGDTACYQCYCVRRDAALAPWERLWLSQQPEAGSFAHPLAVDWLMVEVTKYATRIGEPVSRNRILAIDYLLGIPEVHPVLRVPACSACGPARRPAARAWR